jgi:hypothetical protein
LNSVAWADEVFVVDSFSHDRANLHVIRMHLVRGEVGGVRVIDDQNDVPVAVGIVEIATDVQRLDLWDEVREGTERLGQLAERLRLAFGILRFELPCDDVPDHDVSLLRALSSRSASTRQMLCTRSLIRTTGISSAYCSTSTGSSSIDRSTRIACGFCATTAVTTTLASSQR